MATESPVRIVDTGKLPKLSFRPPLDHAVADELGLLLRTGHRLQGDQASMVPNRSGSAPPSMEGSYAAFGNILYHQTSNLNFNLNPRLPRAQAQAQPQPQPQLHIGSLILGRIPLSTHPEEPEDDTSTHPTSDDDHHSLSLSARHKSLVDLIQEDFPRTPSPVYNHTRSTGHVAADEPIENEIQALTLDDHSLDVPDVKPTSNSGSTVEASQKIKATDDPSSASPHKAAYLNQLGRGKEISQETHTGNDPSLTDDKLREKNIVQQQQQQVTFAQRPHFQLQVTSQPMNNVHNGSGNVPPSQLNFSSQGQAVLQAPGFTPIYASPAAYVASGSQFYSNISPTAFYAPQYTMAGYTFIPPYPSQPSIPVHFGATSGQSYSNHSTGAPTGENSQQMSHLQQYNRNFGPQGLIVHPSFSDPFHMQYFHPNMEEAYAHPGQYGRLSPMSNAGDRRFLPSPSGSLSTLSPRKVLTPGNDYYGSPSSSSFMPQYPASPAASPLLPGSPVGVVNPSGRRNDLRQPSMRNSGVYSGWQGHRGSDGFSEPKKHSFLEELKSTNARKTNLSDIAGRVAEVSVDQYGSRFIQQKLESCTAEEKSSVLKEILPHAPKLMTDVFGNYVIQKFFEHGDPDQRKELAGQLSGQMLTLSLQMYGCRVIQKALEVVGLDQKTELVHELDGHIMRCVRDQNGNHVIQKCIECVPTEKIGFIISAFRGHVASLSAHPYGCRVIQRVLEHCSDDSQSQCVVDEILESAKLLAQDQYGNYVTQHVLERGKPLERSRIINKLLGNIITLSQHKYASNVIEKCLEYGDPAEREILIEEILSEPVEDDNLLTMMKDQFANYVVQKILEISNDRQREMLLDRIRIHLAALKKYTYGKHIVARFEQLSGEEEECESCEP